LALCRSVLILDRRWHKQQQRQSYQRARRGRCMSVILFHYEKVNPTSWAYLSSLLMLALFFKFNRVFSVRNLDLFLLISIAPGLLLVKYGFENEASQSVEANALAMERLGFLWLFAVHGLIMAR